MSEPIAAAARRWDEARREALELKKKRAAFLCELTEKSEWGDPDAPFKTETTTPCWKQYEPAEYDGEGRTICDGGRWPPEEQCASCRDRYAVHLAMRSAIRRRGANLRAMMALLAAERKRLAKTSQEASREP